MRNLFNMISVFLKNNIPKGYLNNVAVLTIALSVFIVATFLLFLINANDMVKVWKKGVRVMAYLEPDVSRNQVEALKADIRGIRGVENAVFISKKEALAYLKERLKGQLSVFEDLDENPLPDAFEISLSSRKLDLSEVSALTEKIKDLEKVESVEYGQAWLQRFTNIFNLFQFATFGIAGLFFMASVFIIGNTIRLMLFSKRDEIEIMRLVGASESFIKRPFYIEGVAMGTSGGLMGLLAVYIGYLVVSSSIVQTDTAQLVQVRFFSWWICLGIIGASIFVGWLGCVLSLAQYFKK